MKIRHIALLAAISFFASGNSWAQDSGSNSNFNSNFNNNMGNFGSTSFSQTSNNMTITQSIGGGSNDFCQFFSFTFGMTQIIQIIQGNSFTQVFGSPSDVEDPCL